MNKDEIKINGGSSVIVKNSIRVKDGIALATVADKTGGKLLNPRTEKLDRLPISEQNRNNVEKLIRKKCPDLEPAAS